MYSFQGFPSQSHCHLLLHRDGFPTGAAWRFAAALRLCDQPVNLPACFRRSQPDALPLDGPEGLDQHPVGAPPITTAEVDYHYRLIYCGHPSPELQVQVQVWRRLPGSRAWSPRCGPMPLAVFISRFLPEPDQRRNTSR